MCQLQQSIEPDAKLKKMIGFLKIVLAINIIVVIAQIALSLTKNGGGNFLMEMFCCMFLLMVIYTINYMLMGLFIFFSLYNSVFVFIELGTLFQIYLMNGTLSSVWLLGVDTFEFCFYIFAIIVTFPIYKEMKAQFLGSIGAGGAVSRDEESHEQAAPVNSGTSSNFRAFSGRGVAVGGN